MIDRKRQPDICGNLTLSAKMGWGMGDGAASGNAEEFGAGWVTSD
jgi:hypothetical protein